MSKRPTSEPIQFQWKRWKNEEFLEYYGHPSPLARELWLHVLGIGKTRCEPGHVFQRAGNRVGRVVHYVHRGEMWHRIQGQMFRAAARQACLLDLSRKFAQGNDQQRSAGLWWISFDGKDLPRLLAELGVDRNPVFDHLNHRRIEGLFRDLWRLTSHQPPACEAESHALLSSIVAELFASRARQADWAQAIGNKATLSSKIQMAVDFIERMHFKNIGLKHVASAVGLNLHHLSRRFHDEVGMPPIHYLNRFRTQQAKRLLATTTKSAAEVGRLVGIADQSYFSRLFSKITGVTPARYRAGERQRRGKAVN